MCKKLLLPFVIVFLTSICSCKKVQEEHSIQNEYVVSISIKNHNNRMVYLHKFISDIPQIIDSSKVSSNQVEFTGYTPFPERYLITLESIFGSKLLILTNDSIRMEIPKKDLENALITGSALNTELSKYQNRLKKIYLKIDVLFPQLQLARLENDPVRLEDISTKIKAIQKEGDEFNFHYAQENSHSFLAPMILNDLSKNDSIDIQRIQSTYEQFPDSIKSSNDSEELFEFLENYK